MGDMYRVYVMNESDQVIDSYIYKEGYNNYHKAKNKYDELYKTYKYLELVKVVIGGQIHIKKTEEYKKLLNY